MKLVRRIILFNFNILLPAIVVLSFISSAQAGDVVKANNFCAKPSTCPQDPGSNPCIGSGGICGCDCLIIPGEIGICVTTNTVGPPTRLTNYSCVTKPPAAPTTPVFSSCPLPFSCPDPNFSCSSTNGTCGCDCFTTPLGEVGTCEVSTVGGTNTYSCISKNPVASPTTPTPIPTPIPTPVCGDATNPSSKPCNTCNIGSTGNICYLNGSSSPTGICNDRDTCTGQDPSKICGTSDQNACEKCDEVSKEGYKCLINVTSREIGICPIPLDNCAKIAGVTNANNLSFNIQIPNLTKYSSLSEVIVVITNLFKVIVILSFAGVIVYGGLIRMTAQGNDAQIQKSTKIIIAGIIGFAIIVLAQPANDFLTKLIGARGGLSSS